MSAREHATRTRGALTKPVRTNSRKGSGPLADYAQSPRGAYTEATSNRLEVGARIDYRTVVDRRERDGESLPQFTVGDGCQVLTPQRDASDTCPNTVLAA